jgi:hypothetical protein
VKAEIKKVFDEWCKKSKKICAVCDIVLAGRKPPKEYKGRMWCSYMVLRHPLFKSKKYKLCGDCYSNFIAQGNQDD